jgi:hypothetical protein
MTKAEQIRALWKELPDTSERTRIIADRVGCRTEYVRVVARQRVGSGLSAIEKRYVFGRFGSLQAYYRHLNERSKEYRSAYWKKRRREDRAGAG